MEETITDIKLLYNIIIKQNKKPRFLAGTWVTDASTRISWNMEMASIPMGGLVRAWWT